MKAHELQTTQTQKRTRSGRGISAGRGKTAGRGTKGQNSRAGSKRSPGFEGGQSPLFQRLPKQRGFTSFHAGTTTITTQQIAKLGNKVNNEVLFNAGFINHKYEDVKLVLKGDLDAKQTVELTAASKGAIAAIEKAGGTFTAVGRMQRPQSKKSD